MATPPPLPREMLLRYTDVPEGRIRTRVLGSRRGDVAPVVVVQGMAVSDYLLPACAAIAEWTEIHLLDLPGYAGSGEPTRDLDVRGVTGRRSGTGSRPRDSTGPCSWGTRAAPRSQRGPAYIFPNG